MKVVRFSEADKIPGQKIERAFIDQVHVRLDGILVPIPCIKRLIEKIEEGKKGIIHCEVTDRLSNYLGATITENKVILSYNKDKTEDISMRSLLRIKKVLEETLSKRNIPKKES